MTTLYLACLTHFLAYILEAFPFQSLPEGFRGLEIINAFDHRWQKTTQISSHKKGEIIGSRYLFQGYKIMLSENYFFCSPLPAIIVLPPGLLAFNTHNSR